MTRRWIARALACATVVLGATSCGVDAQSEPMRLDTATSTPPVPTVTQRPDHDDPCPAASPAPVTTPPSTPSSTPPLEPC